MRLAITLTATALLLAGCGERADKEARPTASSSDQAAPAGVGESSGPEVRTVAEANALVPNRKLGEWRMTSATNGQQMPEYKECATEKNQAWDANLNGGTCGDFHARRQGDAVVMTAVCEAPMGDTTMETRITGDLQSSYAVDTTISNPSNSAAPLTKVKVTGTYVGPTCS